ncbi:hypothetical protein MBLNU457_g0673t2 [Dothideomycetes sp. NU457]
MVRAERCVKYIAFTNIVVDRNSTVSYTDDEITAIRAANELPLDDFIRWVLGRHDALNAQVIAETRLLNSAVSHRLDFDADKWTQALVEAGERDVAAEMAQEGRTNIERFRKKNAASIDVLVKRTQSANEKQKLALAETFMKLLDALSAHSNAQRDAVVQACALITKAFDPENDAVRRNGTT